MQTTLSDCRVQPAPKRSGSARVLRLFCGGLLAIGLGLFSHGCGSDVANDEAAITQEVNAMLDEGPSSVQEIYAYDVDASGEISVEPSSDDVDSSGDPNTSPGGGSSDPSPGRGGCGPKPPTPPMPPVPPMPPMCTKEKQGGATSCKDEKTWRSYGEAFCKMKGLSLKNVTFDTSCGRGEWRYATYECCRNTMPPPPPPPPGPRCTNNKAGDGRTCKDRATWRAEGAKFCASKMAILTVLTLEDRCGMGDNWKTAHFECCGWTPPPPPPPPPPMCVGVGAGGSGTCKSQADWKAEAERTCKSRGLSLKTINYGAGCRRPDGSPGHSDVKFECCPGTPPPPPPPMCIKQTAGDPSVCKSDVDWKAAGEAFCKSKMLTLKNITFGMACMMPMGRGFSSATFECCPGTPPPPPPPPMCIKYTDGPSSTSCKTDADWKMSGERYCASKMLTLKNITFGMACPIMGARGFNSATYECCPGTPPPPPPPMCTTDLVGGAGVCRSEADWKMSAEAFCKAKGSTLRNISFGAACMSGMTRGYSEAKIECCK
ncbi:MAG: hypothetical protein JNJ46_18060 [Myxococcales bacterium]|nr:hypothetical protein [Myxococcales bacterium]